jgi:hypothetical protein
MSNAQSLDTISNENVGCHKNETNPMRYFAARLLAVDDEFDVQLRRLIGFYRCCFG